jgi:hypothetical protein
MKFGDNLKGSDRKNRSSKGVDKDKNSQNFNNKVHPGSKRRGGDRTEGTQLLNMDTARSGQSNDGEDQILLNLNQVDDKNQNNADMTFF